MIVDVRLALARGDRCGARDVARSFRPEAIDSAPLRALAFVSRGLALAGVDPEKARRDGAHALAVADGRDWPLLVLQARTVLALSAVYGRRPREAAGHAAVALDLAAGHGGDRTPWSAGALLVRAVAHLVAGRPGEALVDVARCAGAVPHAAALGVVRRAAEYDAGRPAPGGQRRYGALARRSESGPQEDAGPEDPVSVAFAALLDQDIAL